MVALLILLLLVIVALGRLSFARQSLDSAAHTAARAASLARSSSAARWAAHRSATTSIHQGGTSCHRLKVAVDISAFTPGGSVTVTLTCAVALADLGLPGLPGTVAVSRSATSPLDTFRGVTP